MRKLRSLPSPSLPSASAHCWLVHPSLPQRLHKLLPKLRLPHQPKLPSLLVCQFRLPA